MQKQNTDTVCKNMDEAIHNLVSAVEKERTDIVRSIIDACENCERNNEGDIQVDKLLNSQVTSAGTVLHLASKLGYADIVRALLAGGADPGIHNGSGETPLDLALSPKVYDVFGEELLQATAQSNVGRVCQLLAAGVSVNLLDSSETRNTPLHWAATYSNPDMVQCLCKRNADVNAVNIDGATALHDAINRGEWDIVTELLQHGAATDIKPINGKYRGMTVDDLARDIAELSATIDKVNNLPVNGHKEEDGTPEVIANGIPPQMPNGDLDNSTEENPPLSKDETPSTPSKTVDPLIFPSVAAPLDPLVTDTRLNLLWPRPQKVIQGQGASFMCKEDLIVFVSAAPSDELHAICDTWRRQLDTVRNMGRRLMVMPQVAMLSEDKNGHVLCQINSNLFLRPESYKINVSAKQIKIVASDVRGLFYGSHTFLQLLRLCGPEGIPPLQIHDWPNLRDRGVMLDLSNGRTPHLDTLRSLLEMAASLKVNQVMIYSRFKAQGDQAKDTWQLPYSPSELLNISWLCRELQLKLIPVVDVAPRVDRADFQSSPDLLLSIQEFLECFTCPSIIGIGPRMGALLVDIGSNNQLDLSLLYKVLQTSSRQLIQLCASIFKDIPEVLPNLPSNVLLLEYGFKANYDFDAVGRKYCENGAPFSVLAGTAAWNSLAGCPEAAVNNIHGAVQSAMSHGALGLHIANWTGFAHMTHHCFSWPGFLMGAGLAWNHDIRLDFLHANVADLLNHHVLLDSANITGQVLIELGRAETYVLRCARQQTGTEALDMPAEEGSTLLQLILHPDKVALENLSLDIFQRAMRHIRKCVSELTKSMLACEQAIEVQAELQLAADLMISACKIGRALVYAGRKPSDQSTGLSVVNMGISNLPPTHKTDLANRLLSQIDTYQKVWLMRQLEFGITDSMARLNDTLHQFLPEGQQSPNLQAKS